MFKGIKKFLNTLKTEDIPSEFLENRNFILQQVYDSEKWSIKAKTNLYQLSIWYYSLDPLYYSTNRKDSSTNCEFIKDLWEDTQFGK